MINGQFLLIAVTTILIGCNTSPGKTEAGAVNTPPDSTRMLFDNIKGLMYDQQPLRLDSSAVDLRLFTRVVYPDTSACNSFSSHRRFLGKLDHVKTIVHKHGSRLFLRSGNLSLWVCNIPPAVKESDTLVISALVYDILGNEKTFGYPTILTKVMMLPELRAYSKLQN